MAPGFVLTDFEGASSDELIASWPQRAELIRAELGRGLDIARRFGVADLDDSGEWVVGDLSRLEVASS